MTTVTRAKLLVLEPGVKIDAELARPNDHNHVFVLGPDEAPEGFCNRVQQRADSLKRHARLLENVTYLVGDSSQADWAMRTRLLSALCDSLAPDGSVAVKAPSSASTEVLSCLGDLQVSVAQPCQLRAVFT
jgi:hypothetical protein